MKGDERSGKICFVETHVPSLRSGLLGIRPLRRISVMTTAGPFGYKKRQSKFCLGGESNGSTGVRGKIETMAAENLILLALKSGHQGCFFRYLNKKKCKRIPGSRILSQKCKGIVLQRFWRISEKVKCHLAFGQCVT